MLEFTLDAQRLDTVDLNTVSLSTANIYDVGELSPFAFGFRVDKSTILKGASGKMMLQGYTLPL